MSRLPKHLDPRDANEETGQWDGYSHNRRDQRRKREAAEVPIGKLIVLKCGCLVRSVARGQLFLECERVRGWCEEHRTQRFSVFFGERVTPRYRTENDD